MLNHVFIYYIPDYTHTLQKLINIRWIITPCRIIFFKVLVQKFDLLCLHVWLWILLLNLHISRPGKRKQVPAVLLPIRLILLATWDWIPLATTSKTARESDLNRTIPTPLHPAFQLCHYLIVVMSAKGNTMGWR
jgi:hypothetical protein